MNFELSPGLTDLINRAEKQLKKNFFFSMILGIGYYPIALHAKFKEPVGIQVYIWGEIMALFAVLFLYRLGVFDVRKIINKTAIAVTISDGAIILKTSPLKAFLFGKGSGELKFDINKVKIIDGPYPLKTLYSLDKGTFKLVDKEKEGFIIIEYFDKELSEKIREMYYNR